MGKRKFIDFEDFEAEELRYNLSTNKTDEQPIISKPKDPPRMKAYGSMPHGYCFRRPFFVSLQVCSGRSFAMAIYGSA